MTPSGALKVPTKELTIAPNITTHYPVQYAEAGRIDARYTYKGETSWGGKEVVGDTFVAANGGLGVKPEYEVRRHRLRIRSRDRKKSCYAAKAPSPAPAPTATTIASTAAGSKYPLAPVPLQRGWEVFAGDCPANNLSRSAVRRRLVVKERRNHDRQRPPLLHDTEHLHRRLRDRKNRAN